MEMELPRLVDGTALDEEQSKHFWSVADMLKTTESTGMLQTKHKAEHHGHEAAELLASSVESKKWVMDSACIRRYLVANAFNDKKAYDAILKTVWWRSTHMPSDWSSSAYSDCLGSKFMEWRGHDRAGRPNMFIVSRNADLSIAREQRLKFMSFALEKGLLYMKPEHSGHANVEQWNMIVDETDKDFKHTDNRFLSQVSPLLFSHYVERLHRCYLINPGFLTKAALSCIRLFIDERTSSKLVTVSAKRDPADPSRLVVPRLVDEIGEDTLPVEYGGKAPSMTSTEYASFLDALGSP